MNKKQFWKGFIIALTLMVLTIVVVAGTPQKWIQVNLGFWMDEEAFNESKDCIQEKYNQTPKEYLEEDIPKDWEGWFTGQLRNNLTQETRRISATNNNTIIKQAIASLVAIDT